MAAEGRRPTFGGLSPASRITRAEQGIAEARMEILSLKEQRDAEVVTELREVPW